MGTAFTPAKTSPASWDAFSDVEAFVDAVLAELAAMAADGTRRRFRQVSRQLAIGRRIGVEQLLLMRGDEECRARIAVRPRRQSARTEQHMALGVSGARAAGEASMSGPARC